jgi:hypothetical protein
MVSIRNTSKKTSPSKHCSIDTFSSACPEHWIIFPDLQKIAVEAVILFNNLSFTEIEFAFGKCIRIRWFRADRTANRSDAFELGKENFSPLSRSFFLTFIVVGEVVEKGGGCKFLTLKKEWSLRTKKEESGECAVSSRSGKPVNLIPLQVLAI